METHRKLILLLSLISPCLFFILLYFLFYFLRIKWFRIRIRKNPLEEDATESGYGSEPEKLVAFAGGEDLTVQEILDAPGEVVGKLSYGTLYRAGFERSGSVMMLRFVRPNCVGKREEVADAVRVIGSVRDPNLVEMWAVYVGPRGERLLVYPFYEGGDLGRFLKDGKPESHRWEIIYKLSLGIARGLDHLHNGLQKPIIHGNLKSKNILLDPNHNPRLSDFGLHLILNPTSAQEMLESSASQCYKAPELIKMKDASKESDIYSLGVIFLEILTRKESTNLHLPDSLKNLFFDQKISDRFSQSEGKSSTIEESLVKFFHLAISCCSPSPVLRPDIKQIIKKLEELYL